MGRILAVFLWVLAAPLAAQITEIIDAAGDGGGKVLDFPARIAVDGSGNVYVTGIVSNNAFRITPGGTITEIIDATGDGGGNVLSGPARIAVDGLGNVYVAGRNSDNVFRITPGGTITEIIDATGDGGGNLLNEPFGIAVDSLRNVYVAGLSSFNVFRITPGGTITEIIGAGTITNCGECGPIGVAVDGADNVHVTSNNRVFRITPGGIITEITFGFGPRLIAVDAADNLYVTASSKAFQITPGGTVTEIINATGDGGGNVLDGPNGIAVDGSGNVYVTGFFSDNVFQIGPGGTITEVLDATGDGGGNLLNPSGVAVDGSGNVYVAGAGSDNVLRIASGDLSITKSASPEPVDAAASLTYTLNVSNGGPSTATSVVVTDTLPAGVGFLSASGTGWSCGEAGGVVTCTRASLAPGAAPAITVSVTAPVEGAIITNVVSVAAAAVDLVPADNTAEATTTVTALADLSITKSASPEPVDAAASLTYTLNISNGGPSTATSVVVTDTLPAGVSFLSASGTGWSCGEAGGVVTCTLASLAVGAAPAITVDVTSAEGGTLTNVASVAAAEADQVSANDTASATTTVTALADLEITKSASPDPVEPGAALVYTLSVSNGGPSTATSVVVTDTLPAGVGFVGVSGTGWSCGEASGVVTCTRASLAVGAAPTITVDVTAPAAGGAITNNVSVTAVEADPSVANNSASTSTYGPTIVAPGQSVVLDVAAGATCEEVLPVQATPGSLPSSSFEDCYNSSPTPSCTLDAGARILKVDAGKGGFCTSFLLDTRGHDFDFDSGPHRLASAAGRLISEFEIETPTGPFASTTLPVHIATEVSWDGMLLPIGLGIPIFSQVIGTLQVRDTATGLVVGSNTFLFERSSPGISPFLPFSCTLLNEEFDCTFSNPADSLVNLTNSTGADLSVHLRRGHRYAVEVEARCDHLGTYFQEDTDTTLGFIGSFGGCFFGAQQNVQLDSVLGSFLDLSSDGFEVGAITVTVADDIIEELNVDTDDEDGDGVTDDVDVCPGTVIPESVPTRGLGRNRWALVDGDGVFNTNTPPGGGPGLSFTIDDTAGCSCEQIIEAQGLGRGHEKFGCSISAMKDWVALVVG